MDEERRRRKQTALYKWRAANPEKRKEIERRWRERHREELHAKNKAYREANRDKERARWARWYASEANAARAKVKASAWSKANRDRRNLAKARRKASLIGKISTRDWRRLVTRFGGLCAYCQQRPWEDVDHVIPLTRGGQHTIGNVLPACGPCNGSKSTRLLIEWPGRTNPRAA